jgi:hypothetical protein
MVEKCSYTISFFFVFFFNLIQVIGFSIGSLLPSSFEALSNYAWGFILPTIFFTFIGRSTHMFHHISTSMPPTIQCIIERTFMTIIT